MIVSKIVPRASSLGLLLTRNGLKQFSTTVVKQGGGHARPGSYRVHREPPEFNKKFAFGCGVFAWWWIWWHMMTDYHHITGHWYKEFTDRSTWTDAELGIPPDDADDPE